MKDFEKLIELMGNNPMVARQKLSIRIAENLYNNGLLDEWLNGGSTLALKNAFHAGGFIDNLDNYNAMAEMDSAIMKI